ncbi:MAG: LysM peptidoglycan-binding domain-containing protein [Candidatus Promineifilaceae bacterium]
MINPRARSLAVRSRIERFALFSLLLVLTLIPVKSTRAQSGEATPTPPLEGAGQTDSDIPLIHVVLEGETLFYIAEQYGTTIETLQILNSISDPSVLFVGQQLIIPGGGGDTIATIHTIRAGDTLAGIAADYNTTTESLVSANGLINPYLLTIGRPITVVSRTGSAEPQVLTGDPYIVRSGDTLLAIAAENGLSPAEIISANQLPYPAYLHPGQRLRMPGEDRFQDLPDPWRRVDMYPVPVSQGQSVAIYVEAILTGRPFGRFADQTLQFAAFEDGYLALIGLDAFTEPGRYELLLEGAGEQPWRPFTQQVLVQSGGYGIQYIDIPEELAPLLAPEIRAGEDAFLEGLYTQFTDTAYWDGSFTIPITGTIVSAPYGDSRSYNQGPLEIFHTGIDFVGPIGTPIYAPAAGKVVYSDTLQLRGNTLILDHGLGLMSGYYHLSAIHVEIGDIVEVGQHIADGGSTGLSSGPHLHWDVRIMNSAVDGLQWIEEDVARSIPR